MVQVWKNLFVIVWQSSTEPKAKIIWSLDSAHQNSWKPLSFSNSCAHTHQKLISNQLYSNDKMMVQVTKTHIILCLMMFHSTKIKMIWYLDSAHQNSWKALSFSNSYAHIHQKQIYNQLYSSDKMLVQVTKTHIILCLMIFHSTKMKNDLMFEFSTSKQLESTLFQQFICSHTLETNL